MYIDRDFFKELFPCGGDLSEWAGLPFEDLYFRIIEILPITGSIEIREICFQLMDAAYFINETLLDRIAQRVEFVVFNDDGEVCTFVDKGKVVEMDGGGERYAFIDKGKLVEIDTDFDPVKDVDRLWIDENLTTQELIEAAIFEGDLFDLIINEENNQDLPEYQRVEFKHTGSQWKTEQVWRSCFALYFMCNAFEYQVEASRNPSKEELDELEFESIKEWIMFHTDCAMRELNHAYHHVYLAEYIVDYGHAIYCESSNGDSLRKGIEKKIKDVGAMAESERQNELTDLILFANEDFYKKEGRYPSNTELWQSCKRMAADSDVEYDCDKHQFVLLSGRSVTRRDFERRCKRRREAFRSQDH